jgi:hypothetical protein
MKAEDVLMSTMSVVATGLLKADGTLEQDQPPGLPPGRVRVTLQTMGEKETGVVRLPDAPWSDDSIPAPFDLPRPGVVERVQPRPVAQRLPEFVEGLQEDAE